MTIPSVDQPIKPEKSKSKWARLLILFSISLIICVAGVIFYWSFRAKPSLEGAYQDTRYTSPRDNFYCDFGMVMSTKSFNPVLTDYKANNGGIVWARDDLGDSYGVDYFNKSILQEETRKLLENSATIADGLEKLFRDKLYAERNKQFPGVDVVEDKIIEENILFAVMNVPKGSYLADSKTGSFDVQEADYVITKTDWYYFVYYSRSLGDTFNDREFTIAEMESHLAEFYRGCVFQP